MPTSDIDGFSVLAGVSSLGLPSAGVQQADCLFDHRARSGSPAHTLRPVTLAAIAQKIRQLNEETEAQSEVIRKGVIPRKAPLRSESAD